MYELAFVAEENMIELETKDLDQVKSGKVVLKFFGTACGNCKMQESILAQLVSQFADIKFFKLDVAKFPELVDQYDIVSLPTICLLKSGELVESLVGLKPKVLLQKKFEEL